MQPCRIISAVLVFLGLNLITAPGSEGATITRPGYNAKPDLTKLQSYPAKPRVFVISDILNEPDDSESLVRYLLYSNEFDTRGICAVTSTWLPNTTHPEAMRQIVNAYGSVVGNLNKHVHPKFQYPDAYKLLPLVTSGPAVYGKEALSLPLSDGARLLIQRLEESTKPLYAPVWGGTNVIAQALQHVQKTRSAPVGAALRSRLRIYSISDQDDTGEWIRNKFPDIFYISSIHAWNMYGMSTWEGISATVAGADSTKVSAPWLKEHIQVGPLGAQYPTPINIMEGDTASFLYLIQNGLGNPEFPNYGSWGGRYGPVNIGSFHYADTVDDITGVDGNNYTDQKSTVYRWRDHYQNDFAARIRWTLTADFWAATHPPVPVVNGSSGPAFLNLTVRYGQTVTLDASQSYNPDDPSNSATSLNFQWYQYVEPTFDIRSAYSRLHCTLRPLSPRPSTKDTIAFNDAGFRNVVAGERIQVTVPSVPYSLSYHIVLQISSKTAVLPLRRYLRVILNTQP